MKASHEDTKGRKRHHTKTQRHEDIRGKWMKAHTTTQWKRKKEKKKRARRKRSEDAYLRYNAD